MATKRGKRWLARVRVGNGERLCPSFPSKKEAEDWEREARRAVEEGRPVPDPKTGKSGGREGPRSLSLLGALFDHVCRTEWNHLRSSETAIKNGSDVVDYFGRKRGVDTIGSQDIAEMKAHFSSSGLAPATVNRKAAALSRMLHVAVDAGIIPKVPKTKWMPEQKTKFRYLDQTEEAVLLTYWKSVGNEDLHDLCILLIDSGARCFSEMLPVQWDAFGQNYGSITFWHTKTNQPRSVPLTTRCREVLKRRRKLHPESRGPFTGVSHGGLTVDLKKNTIRHQWDDMRSVTGMGDVTPHTLRHTCCTRLILGGVDVKRVMTWMGHTSIATTMRYMQIKPTALEDVLHVLEGKSA